ncbi:hypothetical protein GS528_27910 [Rhodococcus hoagii]|nr:hypothetical protein [Prescottella equi]
MQLDAEANVGLGFADDSLREFGGAGLAQARDLRGLPCTGLRDGLDDGDNGFDVTGLPTDVDELTPVRDVEIDLFLLDTRESGNGASHRIVYWWRAGMWIMPNRRPSLSIPHHISVVAPIPGKRVRPPGWLESVPARRMCWPRRVCFRHPSSTDMYS